MLTSGLPVNNPAQLLHSPALRELLNDAEILGYQTVIFDLPAVLPVVDAAMIAEKVDGTVLVVSADRSGAAYVRETLDHIDQVGIKNVLGLVVNRVRRDATMEEG